MKTPVYIRAEDVALGSHCSSLDCPLARAVNRALAPGYFVGVGSAQIVYYRPGDALAHLALGDDVSADQIVAEAPLSPAARRFVHAFDTGGGVRLSRFTFDIPEEALPPTGDTPPWPPDYRDEPDTERTTP